MTASAPTYNGWLVVHLDSVGKRAWVRCASCSHAQQVSVEAFADASLRRCGCSSRESSRVADQA